MIDDERSKRSVAEHVLWCREERDKLAEELRQFEAGTKTIGTLEPGESMTRGSLTRIAYLRRNIEQLNRVIRAFPESSESSTKLT